METPNSETQQRHIHNTQHLQPVNSFAGLIFTFFAISKIPHIKIVKIYLKLKQRKGDLKNESEQFNVHPAIIKILADRGIQGEEAVREYLEADISRVSDGSELTDMQRGVDIVYDAVKAGKYIRIMGDYDVDGVSSTYILYKGLTGLGAKCDKFIPHRITDGYGLHEPAIRDA